MRATLTGHNLTPVTSVAGNVSVETSQLGETAVNARNWKVSVECVREPLLSLETVSAVSVTGFLRNAPLLGTGGDS